MAPKKFLKWLHRENLKGQRAVLAMQIPGMCLYQTSTEALENNYPARKVRSIFARVEVQASIEAAQLWNLLQVTLIPNN